MYLYPKILGSFFKNEFKGSNLLYNLKESEQKEFKIQIAYDILNEWLSEENLEFTSENIYDNNNLYTNMLDPIKFTSVWCKIIPYFIKYANDDLIKNWWNEMSKYPEAYNLLKNKKNIWKRINPLVNYSKIDKTKANIMGDMGFSD